MREAVVIEKLGNGATLPIGSLVNWEGQPAFYRDITSKHIFKKGNYRAIGADDCTIKFLKKTKPNRCYTEKKGGNFIKPV